MSPAKRTQGWWLSCKLSRNVYPGTAYDAAAMNLVLSLFPSLTRMHLLSRFRLNAINSMLISLHLPSSVLPCHCLIDKLCACWFCYLLIPMFWNPNPLFLSPTFQSELRHGPFYYVKQPALTTDPVDVIPQDGRNDFYCWVCHREGQVLCCELCPRVYHAKCLKLAAEPEGDWFCPECEVLVWHMRLWNITLYEKLSSQCRLLVICKYFI